MDDVWDIQAVVEKGLVIRDDEKDKTMVMDREWQKHDLAERVVQRLKQIKKLKLFKVYVDEGNLAVFFFRAHPVDG